MPGTSRQQHRVEYGFFRPERGSDEPKSDIQRRGRSRAQAQGEGWGKIISRLIAAGHSYSEIAEYTLGQIRIFSKYAAELERERRAMLIGDLAIASQGEGKAIAGKVKELLS